MWYNSEEVKDCLEGRLSGYTLVLAILIMRQVREYLPRSVRHWKR
jgi:hypothetical protein